MRTDEMNVVGAFVQAAMKTVAPEKKEELAKAVGVLAGTLSAELGNDFRKVYDALIDPILPVLRMKP